MKKNMCMICLSPFKREMVTLHNNGTPVSVIYKRYKDKLNYTASQTAFYQLLIRHKKGGHKGDALYIPQLDSQIKSATIEEFGKRMLDLGMAKIENLDPKDVPLKDVISAQKLVLDAKKLKVTEDAMTAMMSKLFAPKINPLEVIEGEVR